MYLHSFFCGGYFLLPVLIKLKVMEKEELVLIDLTYLTDGERKNLPRVIENDIKLNKEIFWYVLAS